MSSKRNALSFAAVVAGLLVPARSAFAQTDVARLFPRQASIEVSRTSGLVRLPLPVEVLSEARPELSDVRVFDARGVQVPFVLEDASHPLVPRAERVQYAKATPIAAHRATTRRGGLEALCRESFTLTRPDATPIAGAWDLVLGTGSARFVRDVEAREPGSAQALVRGSVFRLPDPSRERLRLPLPAKLPPTLEITLEGEGPCLEPVLAFESARHPLAARELSVELGAAWKRKESDRTVISLAVPRGIRPAELRFVTSTRTFHRDVELRDAGPGAGDRLLARASIFRVQNLPGVEELEVPVEPGEESTQLELTILDGDSPELEALGVFAVVQQPSLIFEAAPELVLRFGGGRARAPEFDLSRFVGTEAGRRLAEEGPLGEARVARIGPSPLFDPKPALDYLLRPGPALDVRRFSHRRRISVRSAPEGASHLRLGVAELAELRDDLGDLRIVDGEDRQWPYLLEHGASNVDVELGVSPGERSQGESHYRLTLPHAPLALDAIAVDSSAAYLNRGVKLYATTDAKEPVLLYAGRLTRRPGRADPLGIAFTKTRVRALELVVDDGSDSALRLDKVAARVASADLFLAAPPGDYWLVAGNPELEAPRYEMSSARDLVLAVPAAAMEGGALEANPRYLPARRWRPSEIALWISIVVAVLVLGGLTLRLARREEDESPPEPGPEVEPKQA